MAGVGDGTAVSGVGDGRGVGVGGSRDGIRSENLVACYTHLHALSAPDWAQGMVRAAAGDVH